MKQWTPAAEGTGFEYPAILKPLEPFRDQLHGADRLEQHSAAPTPSTPPACTPARRPVSHRHPAEAVRHVGSVGRHLDGSARGAAARAATPSWPRSRLPSRDATSPDRATSASAAPTPTPSPGAGRPRRCRWRTTRGRCSSGCSATAAAPTGGARLARMQADKSILDSVSDRIGHLQTRIGTRDRAKLSEYLEAVRDIERRIQQGRGTERQGAADASTSRRACPASFEEHAKLMFDLQVLAYQTDLTRVITFMLGRELSGRTFPELGVSEGHHATSHHQEDPVKLANLERIKTLSFDALCLLPREAAGHAGRRRLAARSHADRLRRRHGRFESPRRRPICRWCSPAARPARSKADATSNTPPPRRSPTCISRCSTCSACRPSTASATAPAVSNT